MDIDRKEVYPIWYGERWLFSTGMVGGGGGGQEVHTNTYSVYTVGFTLAIEKVYWRKGRRSDSVDRKGNLDWMDLSLVDK